MKKKLLYTYDESKLEILTKKMFGEKYNFSKMSEREKGNNVQRKVKEEGKCG